LEQSRYHPSEERQQVSTGKSTLAGERQAGIGTQSREKTMTTSQGLLLVMADIDPAIEHDFNQWYEQEHLAERMAIPGFLRHGALRRSRGRRNIWRSMISNRPTFSSPRTIGM
jgi:hypothetical protein